MTHQPPEPAPPTVATDTSVGASLWGTDADLIEAVIAEIPGAAVEFVARYQNMVFATALRRTGLADLAQDLTQETFLKALGMLTSLRNHEAVRSWLLGILRNLIRESARRMARQPVSLEGPDVVSALSVLPAESPSANLEAQETVQLLNHVLSRLPERYRDILVMRYLEGRSNRDIADALGCSVGAIDVTLHRARRAFGTAARPYLADLTDLVPPGEALGG